MLTDGDLQSIGAPRALLVYGRAISPAAHGSDLSGPDPLTELRVLRDELEAHQPGLSTKARMVIANKADLFGGDGEASVEDAKTKLREIENFVREKMKGADERPLDVVPISGKYSQNLQKVAILMRRYVIMSTISRRSLLKSWKFERKGSSC